jgi:ribonuclease R
VAGGGLQDADARHEVADVLPQLENLHALYKAMVAQRAAWRDRFRNAGSEVPSRPDRQRGVDGRDRAQRRAQADRGMHDRRQRAGGACSWRRTKIPALFRAHEPPPVEKYEDLQQFLREFKLRMPPVEA